MAEVKTTFTESLAGITENQSQVRERPELEFLNNLWGLGTE
jgi:hypothetical protein